MKCDPAYTTICQICMLWLFSDKLNTLKSQGVGSALAMCNFAPGTLKHTTWQRCMFVVHFHSMSMQTWIESMTAKQKAIKYPIMAKGFEQACALTDTRLEIAIIEQKSPPLRRLSGVPPRKNLPKAWPIAMCAKVCHVPAALLCCCMPLSLLSWQYKQIQAQGILKTVAAEDVPYPDDWEAGMTSLAPRVLVPRSTLPGSLSSSNTMLASLLAAPSTNLQPSVRRWGSAC